MSRALNELYNMKINLNWKGDQEVLCYVNLINSQSNMFLTKTD